MEIGRRISAEDFGKPMRCPKCPSIRSFDHETKVWCKGYFGWLKLPGLRVPPCPNCGTALVSVTRRVRDAKGT